MDNLISVCYYKLCKREVINEGCLYCPLHMCKVIGCYNFVDFHEWDPSAVFCWLHREPDIFVATAGIGQWHLPYIINPIDSKFVSMSKSKCLVGGCYVTITVGLYCGEHACICCNTTARLSDDILCERCKCKNNLGISCNVPIKDERKFSRSWMLSYPRACVNHVCNSCGVFSKELNLDICMYCRCQSQDHTGIRCNQTGIHRGTRMTFCKQHECKYLHCFKCVMASSDYCKTHTKKICLYNIFGDYYQILPRDISNIIDCYVYGTNRRLIGLVIGKTTCKKGIRFVKVFVSQVICSSIIYYETMKHCYDQRYIPKYKSTYIYDDKVLMGCGQVNVGDIIRIKFPANVQMPYIGTEIYTLL